MARILMLGWEYPPHIAGGLGMACEGLTKGLSRLGVEILFVVPRLMGGEDAPHMQLADPFTGLQELDEVVESSSKVERIGVPAFLKAYWSEDEFSKYANTLEKFQSSLDEFVTRGILQRSRRSARTTSKVHYGSNIFEEIARYTEDVVLRLANENFDIIHAHDWMTYPAGVALAKISGKPLIVHLHSAEYDRSGSNVNPQIHSIEKMGLESANAVIAVSHYTKSIINREYNVPEERIFVVHNGIYPKQLVHHYRKKQNWAAKVVLFLGRITFQKGPEYFVKAAEKVIQHTPDVIFVMAGTGDMLPSVINMVHEAGLDKHFHFPGFLKEKEVEEIFSAADLYVMPSVSEPFGLSALESINFDTPALISKQSGVAEVLDNALKFDFWDVNRLADLIINGLQHEELRSELIVKAKEELKNLRWDASALKTKDIYNLFH